MKFIREEISGQGKTRYLFAMGKTEAQILYALLDKAARYMPNLFETMQIEARIRNMKNELKDSIPKMPNGQDKGLMNQL